LRLAVARSEIEVLCQGQQCAVHGIHPDIHQPYFWHAGRSLWDEDRGNLPGITREGALELVNAIVELLVSKFGYQRKGAQRGGGKTWTHVRRSKAKNGNFEDIPCTPTGRESGPGDDGYPPGADGLPEVLWKFREPDGTWKEGLSWAPKDELFPDESGKDGNGAANAWAGTDDLIDHDKLCAYVMKVMKAAGPGVNDGAIVNMVRAHVSAVRTFTNEDEERKQRRLNEIPGMVSSAREKLRQPMPRSAAWNQCICPATSCESFLCPPPGRRKSSAIAFRPD
jgi:hypothetical protein